MGRPKGRLSLIRTGFVFWSFCLLLSGRLPAATPATPATTWPAGQAALSVSVAAHARTTATSDTKEGNPGAAKAGPDKSWVKDEADVFNAAQRTRLNGRTRKLFQSTGSEIVVATRVVSSFDTFESLCETLFRDTVKEAGHYRIVLVVLGYESGGKPGTGRGKVYTGLGAGLSHILTREKLESFLTRHGQKMTPDVVIAGLDLLATTLEGHFRREASVAATAPPTSSAPSSASRLRMDLAAGVVTAITLVLLYRRFTRCPQCGARLRKQVKIMPAGIEGGSHAVRRTSKCFACGYIKKGGWI